MNARLAAFASALPERWRRAQSRLDALPPRERLALAAVALAALLAVELMAVLPVRERRDAMVAALQAEHRATDEAEQAARAQLAGEREALGSSLAAAEQDLRRRGAGTASGESLGLWMQRALSGQAVRVVALRDLGVLEIDTPTAANAADGGAVAAGAVADATHAAAPASPEGQTPTEAAPAQAPLFRHRYELTLSGDVAALTTALHELAQRMAPLRIERVRMGSRDGTLVEATVVFVILSAERTWITL